MRFARIILFFATLFVFGLLAALYVVARPAIPAQRLSASEGAAEFDGLPVAASGDSTSMPVTGVESQIELLEQVEGEEQIRIKKKTELRVEQPAPELLIATATAQPPTPAPERAESTPEAAPSALEAGAALPVLPDLPVRQALATQGSLPGLEAFVRSIAGGPLEALRGVYAPGIMALGVVQQPGDDPAFVSPEENTATQFQSAEPFGVFGLLAHNYLAGRYFYSLNPGQEIFLVFGDGSTRRYRVTEISQYERLTLGDVHSDFLDLATGLTLDAAQLFARYYDGPHHLTLQTCIEKDGVWNWGVQFTRAEPVD